MMSLHVKTRKIALLVLSAMVILSAGCGKAEGMRGIAGSALFAPSASTLPGDAAEVSQKVPQQAVSAPSQGEVTPVDEVEHAVEEMLHTNSGSVIVENEPAIQSQPLPPSNPEIVQQESSGDGDINQDHECDADQEGKKPEPRQVLCQPVKLGKQLFCRIYISKKGKYVLIPYFLYLRILNAGNQLAASH